ncbi:hypothetical protein [Rhabdothermincola sediminis]|uniref:hypothetical protein n=1 Tax=Rhabdothermincola sediminis TaxID=2751370 RepID=UPI001AA047DF|nr:hypothetical protein [Rhabdothermincola sediminis]
MSDAQRRGEADGTPVGVCLAEMGDRTRETLRLLLETKAPSVLEVVGDTEAEVAIVDIVGPASRARLAELRRRHPGRPIVGLALDPAAAKDLDAHVLKPVKVDQLVGAVLAVRALRRPAGDFSESLPVVERAIRSAIDDSELESAPPARRAARPPRSVTRAAASIRPRVQIARTVPPGHATAGTPRAARESMLPLVVDAVRTCLRKSGTIRLEHHVGGIIFDAETRSAYTTLSARQLRSLARGSTVESWTVHVGARAGHDGEAASRWSFEQLLWALGVWVCGHQLPPGCDLDQPIRLGRWPDLTRVLPLRHDTAIAATWTRQALSVRELAERLRIAEDDVVLFLCAAHWAGLVVAGDSPVGTCAQQQRVVERKPGRRGRSRFLSAVIKRLRG